MASPLSAAVPYDSESMFCWLPLSDNKASKRLSIDRVNRLPEADRSFTSNDLQMASDQRALVRNNAVWVYDRSLLLAPVRFRLKQSD